MKLAKVLTIAGSDSGGGAGIQADIKTITALGGYATTVVTAITAQNTNGVFGIHEVPTGFIAEQLDLVLSDIGADIIKTGMLFSAQIIETICYILENYPAIPIVVDPVMLAKGGRTLLQDEAQDALQKLLLPRTFLLTPNIQEAEILANIKITNIYDMKNAGSKIQSMGPNAVLIKGGHLDGGNLVCDVLAFGDNFEVFESPRIDTKNTHGTGCTLSSAIACNLAKGLSLIESIRQARLYVLGAIKNALEIGHGHGPLNHMWNMGTHKID